MNVLAIETATETVGVAVRTTEGVEAEFSLTGRRRHVESLTPAMEHLLGQVGLRPGDLDAVAVDLGPGLFTGLRVGIASAKGLAQALGIGVVGLSSVEILVRAATQRGHRGLVLAAVDARRGEVFAAVHDVGGAPGGAAQQISTALFTPADLARALAAFGGAPITACGDGVQRYAAVLGAVDGVSCLLDALAFPPPLTLLTLAEELVRAGQEPLEPGLVVPLYLREADATSNFAQIGQG